jgi:uncharacterized Fe-S radical SAM superfamily protein PflX
MKTAVPLPMSGSTAPFRGEFRVLLRPDGSVVVPDLAEPLIPLLRDVGADEALWRKEPCAVTKPILEATRRHATGFSRQYLETLEDHELWALHRRLQIPDLVSSDQPAHREEASVLDLKSLLARRLLSPCALCERRCPVNRLSGETGFCGLGAGIQVGAYAMLYNEGPLVGAPTFAVFLRGCSLRCSFCYRPDELRAKGREETSPAELAAILDQAARNGAKSWHFLGGNPDESLPGILQAVSLTKTSKPIVWNSALMLTPLALELLKGVVDIWLPDFKFGNDSCASRIAGIEHYLSIIERNLGLLRGEKNVVVRHMEIPGHERCCTSQVETFVLENCPAFLLHTFPRHEQYRRMPH